MPKELTRSEIIKYNRLRNEYDCYHCWKCDLCNPLKGCTKASNRNKINNKGNNK